MFCVLRVCFYFALWDSHIAIPLTISKLFNLHKTFVLRFIRRNCYEIMQRALVIMLVSFGIVTIYKTNMCYLPFVYLNHASAIIILLFWSGISRYIIYLRHQPGTFFHTFFLLIQCAWFVCRSYLTHNLQQFTKMRLSVICACVEYFLNLFSWCNKKNSGANILLTSSQI